MDNNIPYDSALSSATLAEQLRIAKLRKELVQAKLEEALLEQRLSATHHSGQIILPSSGQSQTASTHHGNLAANQEVDDIDWDAYLDFPRLDQQVFSEPVAAQTVILNEHISNYFANHGTDLDQPTLLQNNLQLDLRNSAASAPNLNLESRSSTPGTVSCDLVQHRLDKVKGGVTDVEQQRALLSHKNSALIDTMVPLKTTGPSDATWLSGLWTPHDPPVSGSVRPSNLLPSARKRSHVEISIAGCAIFDLQPAAKKQRRPRTQEEQEKINLQRIKGACLRCQTLKLKCSLDNYCVNCTKAGLNGWTLYSGAALGSCLRSFTDADPFPAAEILQREVFHERRFRVLGNEDRLFVKVSEILEHSVSTRLMPLVPSELTYTKLLQVIDCLIKRTKKDKRVVMIALAIAELLLNRLLRVVSACKSSGLCIQDHLDVVNFTIHHILAFHHMIFSRLNLTYVGFGHEAALILLRESQIPELQFQPFGRYLLHTKNPYSSTTVIGPLIGYSPAIGTTEDHQIMEYLRSLLSICIDSDEIRAKCRILKMDKEFSLFSFEFQGKWPYPVEKPGQWNYKASIANSKLRQPWNLKGETFIHFFCRSETLASDLERLVDAGLKIAVTNSEGDTALSLACRHGKSSHVEVLLRRGAEVGRDDLHTAAERGHDGVVRLLLSAGEDANSRDDSGWTPLHRACKGILFPGLSSSSLACITALLNAGADSSLKSTHGHTPLQWAIHEMLSCCCETWDADGLLAIKELLSVCTNTETCDCCHRLLSFPPKTPFEADWADWLPEWAFGDNEPRDFWVSNVVDSSNGTYGIEYDSEDSSYSEDSDSGDHE